MKFTIDRTKWHRGFGPKGSALLIKKLKNDSDVDDIDEEVFNLPPSSLGKMCCLGQVSKQCGIKDNDLEAIACPSDLNRISQDRLPSWMFNSFRMHAKACIEAMNVNDGKKITDEVRERKLKEIFIANGDELEFIN